MTNILCPICNEYINGKRCLKIHAGNKHDVYLGNYNKKSIKQMLKELENKENKQ